MNSAPENPGFFVWGRDNVAYGPVELPTLVAWTKDERVLDSTWVFDERSQRWQLAAQLPELQMFFRPGVAEAGAPASVTAGFKPGALRRVKILAALPDLQLERFARFMELEEVRQWTPVVKQGDLSDAMYLILEGELRVRLMVGDKETILATLGPGDFFGDISLFDHGPRSADVIANHDSVLLKISAAAFGRLAQEAPEIAAPFLLAVGRTLTARIRADNKRYRDTIYFSRAAGT
jgi:hypothetical protein